jgi:hypothetical protein
VAKAEAPSQRSSASRLLGHINKQAHALNARCSPSAELISDLDRNQFARVARLLALHVADYPLRLGEVPTGTTELVPGPLLRKGTEILAHYLLLGRDGEAERPKRVAHCAGSRQSTGYTARPSVARSVAIRQTSGNVVL